VARRLLSEGMHLPALPQVAPPQASPSSDAGEKIFFTSREFFASLEREIDRARQSISVEMYIWSNDETGNHFFDLLERAAARGVRVRLVLDGVGSWFWIRANQARIKATAIEVKIYHPLRWNFRRAIPEGIPRFFARMNRRNHKKVILIDGKTAFTGSLNITRSSLEWKECGLRLTGEAVPLLAALFENVWLLSGEEPRQESFSTSRLQRQLKNSRVIRSNQFYSLRTQHQRDLKRRILGARHRVWLMTPYFVPTFGVLSSLLKAARNGVDVRLILPRKSDVTFLRWIARLYYRYLLRAGVKVFEYLPEVLHAKMSLVDDWGFIGSSNLNRRSSYLDLELDIVLSSGASLRELERELTIDMSRSEEIVKYVPLGYWRNLLAKTLYVWRSWF